MSDCHVVTLTLTVSMDEMDGTPEQSAEIAVALVEEALASHWDADADIAVSRWSLGSKSGRERPRGDLHKQRATESRVSSEPSFWKWPNVLSDEPVVWYCGADGSWGGCLAGDLLIIPESALTPEDNAALDGVTSTRWDDEPGDIIAAAIERNAR